jgi:hypothetical protein
LTVPSWPAEEESHNRPMKAEKERHERDIAAAGQERPRLKKVNKEALSSIGRKRELEKKIASTEKDFGDIEKMVDGLQADIARPEGGTRPRHQGRARQIYARHGRRKTDIQPQRRRRKAARGERQQVHRAPDAKYTHLEQIRMSVETAGADFLLLDSWIDLDICSLRPVR